VIRLALLVPRVFPVLLRTLLLRSAGILPGSSLPESEDYRAAARRDGNHENGSLVALDSVRPNSHGDEELRCEDRPGIAGGLAPKEGPPKAIGLGAKPEVSILLETGSFYLT
jgi:hypothetical protein